VLALISSRYLFKEVYNYVMAGFGVHKKVAIYGAGEAGMLVYSILSEDKKNKTNVIAFIDDDKSKIGKKINGIHVYDSKDINSDFVKRKRVNEIIISIQKINPSKLIEIVDRLSSLNVKVKVVPPASSWIEGDLKPQQIKQARIEDLLGREPIQLNNPILQKEFREKTVLITGAAGSIGSEISRQVSIFKANKIILIDQSESDLYNLQQYFYNKGVTNITAIVADVRNKKRMKMLFEKFHPTIIFHAAAYKHVPFMEAFPYEAVAVNVKGTKNIVDLAIEYSVEKFVLISTDKAVNPTNVMGATKRIAELYITSLQGTSTTKFITTRFGNVLGSNGSVIPLFQSQIESGGPLTVTDKEITRYFMTIPEACQLVLEAGAMGNGGEIYVFDMGESIKIYDLARNMIQLSGLKFPDDIDIKITGLRPGEKIYEELLASGENTTTTYHEKIMIAKVKEIDTERINTAIEELCTLNNEINYIEIVCKMKEIVPEYISNNSKYGELDEKEIKCK
jgi:FlaA1/EpsC-like NDP-sugar epimerase